MQGLGVGIRVYGDRRDTHFPACSYDPEGYFTPVGYKDFIQHPILISVIKKSSHFNFNQSLLSLYRIFIPNQNIDNRP
jgi:hypothetical protein